MINYPLNNKPDLNPFANKNFECVLTDVLLKNRIVGTIYRLPDTNLDLFMNGFESVLNILSKTKAECLLAGDYNINLLRHNVHEGTTTFILYANSFVPLITKPTRFGNMSSTLIDNIFTNKCNNSASSGLLLTDIIDHLPGVLYFQV